MKGPPCPACGKPSKLINGGKLAKCRKGCGGLFDPAEVASGQIEGGTHGHRPDQRAIEQESGGRRSEPIKRFGGPLRGGL